MEHFFSPNSGDGSSPIMEHFFSPNSGDGEDQKKFFTKNGTRRVARSSQWGGG